MMGEWGPFFSPMNTPQGKCWGGARGLEQGGKGAGTGGSQRLGPRQAGGTRIPPRFFPQLFRVPYRNLDGNDDGGDDDAEA